MSIATKVICDRCGRYNMFVGVNRWPEVHLSGGTVRQSRVLLHRVASTDAPLPDESFELCHDCREAFVTTFMNPPTPSV